MWSQLFCNLLIAASTRYVLWLDWQVVVNITKSALVLFFKHRKDLRGCRQNVLILAERSWISWCSPWSWAHLAYPRPDGYQTGVTPSTQLILILVSLAVDLWSINWVIRSQTRSCYRSSPMLFLSRDIQPLHIKKDAKHPRQGAYACIQYPPADSFLASWEVDLVFILWMTPQDVTNVNFMYDVNFIHVLYILLCMPHLNWV